MVLSGGVVWASNVGAMGQQSLESPVWIWSFSIVSFQRSFFFVFGRLMALVTVS